MSLLFVGGFQSSYPAGVTPPLFSGKDWQFPRRNAPLSDLYAQADELVEEFGLAKLLNSKAAVLSGGEKRRLEIARALIMEPRLILLDEPFSGVDPIAVSEIQQIIMKLTERGIGILLTDHNVRETLNTTDRSYIILDGRIIAHGNREQLLADPNARKYYLGERFEM